MSDLWLNGSFRNLFGERMRKKVIMKKVLIMGVGAQGSTVAQRLDEDPNISEIICADYDEEAASELVKTLKKGRGLKVDASKYDEIVKAAQGVDIIVNGTPNHFGKNVLDAALEVGVDYQDFSAPDKIVPGDQYEVWADGIKALYEKYGKRFSEIGKTAVVGTGAAPGVICVMARRAVRELDSCETINMFVYEGVEAKRFLPFWWSPVIAIGDMVMPGFAYENGKLIRTEPFSLPVKRAFPELGGREVEMIEHAHDEPVYMGYNADKFFKGAKNIYFKYGGAGVNFAKPLFRAGLLSWEEVEIDGQKVIPLHVILAHLPPAPKTREEIQEIINEGLIADEGAFVIEAYGKKDGKDVMIELHVVAPGFVESFEKSGLTSEMYTTGQGGYLFTKMLAEDRFTQKGLITSDMLTDEQVDYYLECAAKLDITYEIEIKQL